MQPGAVLTDGESMPPPPSVYTVFFTFSKALLFRPQPKECFYRNGLAAREARSGLIPFLAVFSEHQAQSTLPVCSSREETHLISSEPHPSQADTPLYCLSMKDLKDLYSFLPMFLTKVNAVNVRAGCYPACSDIIPFALKGALYFQYKETSTSIHYTAKLLCNYLTVQWYTLLLCTDILTCTEILFSVIEFKFFQLFRHLASSHMTAYEKVSLYNLQLHE